MASRVFLTQQTRSIGLSFRCREWFSHPDMVYPETLDLPRNDHLTPLFIPHLLFLYIVSFYLSSLCLTYSRQKYPS